nr:tlde1 domain-containing protein [Rosenbergiella australiborealis]
MSDNVFINGVSRGGFRLYPLRPDGSGLSEGCITFLKRNDFYKVRKNLIHRKKVRVINSNLGLMAYGYVDVQGKSDFDKCKRAKKIICFVLCFILAFTISSYGMPLYSITSWLVDHSYQLLSHYQSNTYEEGSDPITFTSLLTVISLYAIIFYNLIRCFFKKIRG